MRCVQPPREPHPVRGACNCDRMHVCLHAGRGLAEVAARRCRPEPVLRAALRRLVGLLRDGAVNYFYALDQLKASVILTIQQ